MTNDELTNLKKSHHAFTEKIKKQPESRHTLVINAFGGAGAGKSTAALEICEKLKKRGFVAEYVQEYVKELVWEQNNELLDGSAEHQFTILQEQLRRQDRLLGKVDFCVTDSPILLNAIYNNELTPEYQDMLHSLFSDTNNFCFYVQRDKNNFEKEGRIHSLEESMIIDNEIKKMLEDNSVYYGTYFHQTIGHVVENAIATHKRTLAKQQRQQKENKYHHYTREEYQQMSDFLKENVSILEIAKDLGYSPVRKGQKYYSLLEHDSVMIDTQKNCFWRNSDSSKAARGSVLDFVMYFGDSSQQEAYNLLYERIGGKDFVYQRLFHYSSELGHTLQNNRSQKNSNLAESTHTQKEMEKVELELPEHGTTMRNVFAYLTKSRSVPVSIVQEFVDRKMLYQDTHNNCVFVSFNEENVPVYACKRGTNTFTRFVGDCKGCDFEHGFVLRNENAQKLYIAESVIDGMSKMALLQKEGIDYHDYNWHFMAGATKLEALNQYLDNPNIQEITIGLDNDKAGHESTSEIKNLFSSIGKEINIEFPQHNDWNEDLCKHTHERPNPIKDCTKNTNSTKKEIEMG